MISRLNHIGTVMLFALLLCAESCQKPAIPMRTMKSIYSDMAIADANLDYKPDFYLQMDSMALYPPIFEKYGYSTEQFLAAQKYLISHPDKFIKMVEQLKKEIDTKNSIAEREKSIRDSLDNIEYEKQLAIQTAIDNFLDSISFACLLDTIVVRYGDTSAVSDTAAKPAAKPDSVKKRVPVRKMLKSDD